MIKVTSILASGIDRHWSWYLNGRYPHLHDYNLQHQHVETIKIQPARQIVHKLMSSKASMIASAQPTRRP